MGNSLSMAFRSNEIRKGGQLSPLSYIGYTADLNHHLQATGAGTLLEACRAYAGPHHTHGNCSSDTLGVSWSVMHSWRHVAHMLDLITPTVTALQTLLEACRL